MEEVSEGSEERGDIDGQDALLLQPRMALKTVQPCPSMLFSGFPGGGNDKISFELRKAR